jgi:hypothetical protein
MAQHLSDAGLSPQLLASSDSRTMKYIRDNWQREQRIRKALELASLKQPKAIGKSKASTSTPAAAGSKPKSREERQVSDLLTALNAKR